MKQLIFLLLITSTAYGQKNTAFYDSVNKYGTTTSSIWDTPAPLTYKTDTVVVIHKKYNTMVINNTFSKWDTVPWKAYYRPKYDTIFCSMLVTDSTQAPYEKSEDIEVIGKVIDSVSFAIYGFEVLTSGIHVKYLDLNKNPIRYVVWASRQIKPR